MSRYICSTMPSVKCDDSPAEPILLKPTMAQRMICASVCAYAVNRPYDPKRTDNFKPECKYWDLIKSTGAAQLITADASWLHPAVDAAFITETVDGWVVLSLRGTEPPTTVHDIGTFFRSFDDWFQDGKSCRTAFHIDGNNYGSVHTGFHDAYEKMLPEIRYVLDKIDWSKFHGLQVTGHSKGASLTFLYALWAKVHYASKGLSNVVVNAFAPTAIGDSTFDNKYTAEKIPTTRHMRARDAVPFLLPFVSQKGTRYDIYHEVSPFHWNATEVAVWALGRLVHGGYYSVGDVVYYPGDTPGTVPSEAGAAALSEAHKDLMAAIKGDKGDDIIKAHSATDSYYPALVK